MQGDQCNSEYNFLRGPLQTNLLNFHLFDENLDSVCVHSRGSYNKVASQKASAFVCYQLLARYDAYILSKQSLFIYCFPSIRYLFMFSRNVFKVIEKCFGYLHVVRTRMAEEME